MMKALLIAAMAVTLASPAWAGENPASAQASAQQDQGKHGDTRRDKDDASRANPDTAQETKDPDRKICLKQAVLGTRLGQKRVCATAAEWARMRAEEQQATELVQNGKFKSESD